MRKIHSLLIAALLIAAIGALQAPMPAQALSGAISFSPTSLFFSSTYVGTKSTALTVTVKNNLGWDLNIYKLTITGEYKFKTNNCAWVTLPPSATCTFSVIFTPVGLGNRTGSVTVANAVSTTDDKITLSGTGAGTNLLQQPNFDYPFTKPLPWKDGPGELKVPQSLDCSISVSPFCSVRLKGSALNIENKIHQSVARAGLIGDQYVFLLSSKAKEVPVGGQYKVEVILMNLYNQVVGSSTLNFGTGTHGFQTALGRIRAKSQYTWIIFRFTFQETSGVAWFDNAILVKLP